MEPVKLKLFARLPPSIFAPLAAESHERYWALLLHLYEEFFSPESSIPEGDGWTKEELSQSAQRFLLRHDSSDESEERLNTPVNIRASADIAYLTKSGWLTDERIGLVSFLAMSPTVQEFLESLQVFADSSPELVAGRIQAIYNNIRACAEDPGNNAPAFAESAQQCTNLIRLLNNMRLRSRELMQLVRQNTDTGLYTVSFFENFIGEYLSKYYDLLSGNHPLARRWDVISCANLIYDDSDRLSVLTKAYAEHFKLTPEAASKRVEDDLERYLSLRKLDDLMRRLEDSVVFANQQALGFYRYRLRSRGDVDRHVDTAIQALLDQHRRQETDAPAVEVVMGWSSGTLFHERSLRLVANKEKRSRRSVNVPQPLTLEQQAGRLLRRIMSGNRKVSAVKMMAYLDRHLDGKPSIESRDLSVESINDLCLLAGLTRIGIVASRQVQERVRAGKITGRPSFLYSSLLDRYDVHFTGERFQNQFMDAPAIKISLKKKAHAT